MPVITVKPDDPQLKRKGITVRADEISASAAPSAPSQPGFFQRLGEGTGIPTSMAGLKSAIPEVAQSIVNPTRMGVNYAKNLVREGAKTSKAMAEADQMGKEGIPLAQRAGVAGSALGDFLLKGVAGPIGGGAVASGGEDFARKNYPGFAGDALATLLNLVALRKAAPPSAETATNKLAFGAGKGSTEAISKTLPDLRANAEGTPKGVDAFKSVVDRAQDNMNAEVGKAMFPIQHTKIVPTTISQRLLSLITPNMAQTVDGQAAARKIQNAALEFQKPWTVQQLDAERSLINKRLNPFYNKSGTDQYAALANRTTAIDKTIADAIRDTVYPMMDQSAGKPQGYFADLKRRQGSLMELGDQLDTESKRLKDVTARIQGAPRFSRENVSIHTGSAGAPRASIYGLLDAIHKPNPLKTANRRIAQGFSKGSPAAKAYAATLPARYLQQIEGQQ